VSLTETAGLPPSTEDLLPQLIDAEMRALIGALQAPGRLPGALRIASIRVRLESTDPSGPRIQREFELPPSS
jgi:hypothetical protein